MFSGGVFENSHLLGWPWRRYGEDGRDKAVLCFATEGPGLEVLVRSCLCHKNDCKCDNQGDWGEVDRLVAEHNRDDHEAQKRQDQAEAVQDPAERLQSLLPP